MKRTIDEKKEIIAKFENHMQQGMSVAEAGKKIAFDGSRYYQLKRELAKQTKVTKKPRKPYTRRSIISLPISTPLGATSDLESLTPNMVPIAFIPINTFKDMMRGLVK